MIDWNNYTEVGGGSGEVTRFWPDRDNPLKEGDEVAGVLAKKTPKKEDKSSWYLLEDADEVILVWGGTVLDRKLENVGLGSKVAIKYLGEKKNDKTKRTYKDFRVGIMSEPL